MRNYKPTGRPPGAPKRNTNALKHGLYASYISMPEQESLESMAPDKNDDELALARVRLKHCLQKQQESSADEWLEYERVIAAYLHIIVSLTHKNALLGRDRRPAYLTVMEMIQQVNEEQDVSR